jgi:hypothetical protein
MAELARVSVAAQIGASDPAASGHGATVRLVDPGVLRYVSGAALAPNTMVDGVLWLAPDRALQIGGDTPAGSVSDITDGLATFEIDGPGAADLLAMGCTLDVATALVAGRCAQTVFAGVRVVVYRHGAVFRLHVERSLAAYLLQWFQRAVDG